MAARGADSVVAGLDGSDEAMEAVRWAAAEARDRRVVLRLVAAVEPPRSDLVLPPRGVEFELLLGRTRPRLDAAEAAAHEVAADLELDREVVSGSPAAVLAAASRTACVVVVGHRGRGGFSGLLLGSVGLTLPTKAACPTVIVRGRADRRAAVVVGVDGTPRGGAAVGFAFEEASLRGAPVVAVRAWSEPGLEPLLEPLAVERAVMEETERRVLDRVLRPWQRRYPEVEVRPLPVRANAARALVECAADAALVVVGSRGPGLVRGMRFGSVGQALIHHSPCPVAVVHPPIDEEPDPPPDDNDRATHMSDVAGVR
ncbi:universal stress protein [Pseudonocardia dioxanivorans]|jgi:nucleotide-binding universal stress UspA family protein|uniref:universal stress protein n=1 Tax=Pseudonocardia dioxanivorans TaxID=240495 RepID=UPI000CD094C3|nr:universal stress protein [Pseudonocardia dioxanivorans]